MASSAQAPLLGRTIAQRYRLISRLGAGSVAEVYLARHVLIDRLSAIKIVHPELARDPVWRERFLREARAVNRINHPNIVEITDYGEADGSVFLVMEYVPGESLRQLLERGRLGWRRAAGIGLAVASALGRAHEMGVVHRDLKPANVLVVAQKGGDDLVKLTDFGGAKLADAAPLTVRVAPSDQHYSESAARTSSDADAPAMAALALAGLRTGPYAAPELLELGHADPRADLFALGVLLYEATTGALPSSDTRAVTMGGAPSYPPARPEPLSTRAPGTPSFFAEVVSTLLAPMPDDRPRDGFEAADLLRRALERDTSPVSSKRPEPSTPPRAPLPSQPAAIEVDPGIAAAPLDRLAPLCDDALAALEDHVDARAAHGRPVDPEARAALDEARKLCATVHAVSELVASDTRTLEGVQARGRAVLAELGQSLDEAAREHSKALGWAGTIAERTLLVEAQRLSGEHPVPAIEAMVWEQAALEQEEDRARDRAADLAAEMGLLRTAIDRHNERQERELLVVNACLEGRIAAVRSLAVEAWTAVTRAAALAGAPPPNDGGVT